MDITEVLNEAWSATEASNVSADMKAVAFKEAIRLIGQSRLPTPSNASRQSEPAAHMADSTPARSTGASEPAGFDSDAAYTRLADETEISSDQLREVILFTDAGEVHVQSPARKLGSNVAFRARNIASLVVGARHVALKERSVSLSRVRDACQDRGCYDSKNFKSFHLARHEGFTIRGDDLWVNPSKWMPTFKTAMRTALGEATAE